MSPRLFRTAFLLALLALTLQLLAVSVGSHRQNLEAGSGQAICTPVGIIWIALEDSQGKTSLPDGPQSSQYHCPLCTVAQALPVPLANYKHPTPLPQITYAAPVLQAVYPAHPPYYFQAVPRAPPYSLHS